ncbi:hypothetical protein TNCV_1723381 [Trichonephila clavipes]|nr:hypothetical protein TNCV_1723381 [Trichonephila clavipes]
MTGKHLSDCPALLHVLSQDNCEVLLPARATSALYWTARRLMSERTSAGVLEKAVTPKSLRGPPVDRDRPNTNPWH